MKTIYTKTGPFLERPHFEPQEIEHMCTEALRATDLYPAKPEPIRIDRFIEKRFKVSPRYEKLADGVLGFTKFGRNGVEEIVITTALDEEGTKVAERRIRTTLAHEGGHGLFHAHLFSLGIKPAALFEEEDEIPQILCRDVQGARLGTRSYDGRWWEFQANKAIGGLLMPQRFVQRAIEPFTKPIGLLGQYCLEEGYREEAIRHLSDIFDVNLIVARIRLDDLFPSENKAQLSF